MWSNFELIRNLLFLAGWLAMEIASLAAGALRHGLSLGQLRNGLVKLLGGLGSHGRNLP